MTSPSEVVDPWIYTYSGAQVDLFDPDPATIRLNDIAHSLSNIGRWGGHTTFYWSVAQHSVLVSMYCEDKDAMAGLFHDAAEAYLGDICRPLKRSPFFRDYRLVYRNMERVIMEKFTGSPEIPESVLIADERILATEAQLLMNRTAMDSRKEWLCDGDPIENAFIHPVQPEVARQGFLQRYWRLVAINDNYSVNS